jgi:putative ABC transport system substrate-binding protein
MTLSRRRFVQGAGVAGLGLLAGCGRLPGQTAPPARVPRIGYLSPGGASLTNPPPNSLFEAFRAGLRERGYVEGQSVILDLRAAEGRSEALPALAAELVALPVDVLVTPGVTAIRAAMSATSSIPIVMAGIGVDPVAAGLVASLARPGGNITGPTQIFDGLSGKRLELLTQAAPGITRVAALWNAGNSDKLLEWRATQEAARAMGLQHVALEVRDAADLDGAFVTARQERAGALVVFFDTLTDRQRSRIVDLATQQGLPSMWSFGEFATAGGLMAYGPSNFDQYRRAAYYVDRILKGAKPADLPIEQPTVFEFVINLKTAQALGLTIPQHVLLQATEIIQ